MKKLSIVSFVLLITAIAGGYIFLHKNTPTSYAQTATTGTQATLGLQSNSSGSSSSIYGAADVAKHSTRNDCWTIINNNVYNITSYVPMHPGGVAEIVRACGVDSTNLFNDIMQHGRRADTELAKLKVGSLN